MPLVDAATNVPSLPKNMLYIDDFKGFCMPLSLPYLYKVLPSYMKIPLDVPIHRKPFVSEVMQVIISCCKALNGITILEALPPIERNAKYKNNPKRIKKCVSLIFIDFSLHKSNYINKKTHKLQNKKV